MEYTACIRCGLTNTKHMGKGLCRVCYFADYVPANQKTIQGYKLKWYKANMTPEAMKAKREQDHFAGLREPCLQRDGYQCVKCGSVKQLVVHHKDGNGRPKPEELKNNTLENLETLCRSCHIAAHRGDLMKAKSANGFKRRSGLIYRNSKRNKGK